MQIICIIALNRILQLKNMFVMYLGKFNGSYVHVHVHVHCMSSIKKDY